MTSFATVLYAEKGALQRMKSAQGNTDAPVLTPKDADVKQRVL